MEITKCSGRDEIPSDIGNVLGYSQSTIGTILKAKVRKKEHVNALMKAAVIIKQCNGLIIVMEKLLII